MQDDIDHYLDNAKLSDKPHIIWLDYVDCEPYVARVERFAGLAERLPSRSILKITFNVTLPTVKRGPEMSHAEFQKQRVSAGRSMLGRYGSGHESSVYLSRRRFGAALVEGVRNAASDPVVCGAGAILPLTSSIYADGATMVTATFITCAEGKERQEVADLQPDSWEYYNAEMTPPLLIDVPSLSALAGR